MYPNIPLCPTTRCPVLQKIFEDRDHIFGTLLKRLKYLLYLETKHADAAHVPRDVKGMERGDAAWVYLHPWQGTDSPQNSAHQECWVTPPNPTMQGCSAVRPQTLTAHVAPAAPASSDTNPTHPRVEFMSKDRNGVKNSPKPRKPAQRRK